MTGRGLVSNRRRIRRVVQKAGVLEQRNRAVDWTIVDADVLRLLALCRPKLDVEARQMFGLDWRRHEYGESR